MWLGLHESLDGSVFSILLQRGRAPWEAAGNTARAGAVHGWPAAGGAQQRIRALLMAALQIAKICSGLDESLDGIFILSAGANYAAAEHGAHRRCSWLACSYWGAAARSRTVDGSRVGKKKYRVFDRFW